MFFIVGRTNAIGTDFLKKINRWVWDEEIEPDVFESEWNNVIREFDLVDNSWFNTMYEMRNMWIPAYFRDLYLSGLMRTTSRSESVNSVFTSSTNPHLTLVEFYMRFETALDGQRYNQCKKDYESEHTHPDCKTRSSIEEHAAEIYTISVFYDIQSEVEYAYYNCGLVSAAQGNDVQTFIIKEKIGSQTFQVDFNEESKETSCSCKMFLRKGLPCRHMIWVWHIKLVVKIPDQYILQRWCKIGARNCELDLNLDDQCSSVISNKALINRMWSEMFGCASLAQLNRANLLYVIKNLQAMRGEMEGNKKKAAVGKDALSKAQQIEMLIGYSAPNQVTINPPKISKNKGTGVHIKNSRIDKRLKSEREKAVEESHKKKRICRACKQEANHDSRNCPNKPTV